MKHRNPIIYVKNYGRYELNNLGDEILMNETIDFTRIIPFRKL